MLDAMGYRQDVMGTVGVVVVLFRSFSREKIGKRETYRRYRWIVESRTRPYSSYQIRMSLVTVVEVMREVVRLNLYSKKQNKTNKQTN